MLLLILEDKVRGRDIRFRRGIEVKFGVFDGKGRIPCLRV